MVILFFGGKIYMDDMDVEIDNQEVGIDMTIMCFLFCSFVFFFLM